MRRFPQSSQPQINKQTIKPTLNNERILIPAVQSTPDNSNLKGKLKKVRVIGSSSYRGLEENSRK